MSKTEEDKRYREKHKAKIAASRKRIRQADPERFKDQRNRWRAKNPGKANQHWWTWHRANPHKVRQYRHKQKYGLTPEAYQQLLESQNHRCGGCKIDFSSLTPRNIHVDHCHKTLKVRGILCGRCNRALGMLNDDPIKIQRLADYALATMRLPHL